MILKKLLSVALVAALVVSGSLPALAFNSDDFADESETVKFPPDLFLPTIGGCTLSMVRNFGLGNVNVNITLPGGGATYYPGGSYWAGENRVTGQELTRDILAQCLDVAASQITLIYSYGAGDPLNSNYGDDTIVGFAFSVIQTVSWTDTLGTSHQLQANTAYAFQIGVDGISASNTAAPANTAPVANAGADQTVASAASVTLDGTSSSDADSDALTYTWSQTSGTSVTLSSTTAAQPTFTAPTLAVGDADAVLVFSLTVSDGTTSSSADTVTITVEAPSPTPATAFAEYEEEIRATLEDDARRNLASAMSANQRLIRGALGRMIETQQALSGCSLNEAQNDSHVGAGLEASECSTNLMATRNYVPFDIDGSFNLSGTTVSTRGSFFEQTGNYDGTQRRLFFGDFDVQHDGDTGSTTATLTGRMAWEQMVSDRTMLGYFIGGELAYSNIDGAFEGDQDRIGATIGAYAVHQLAEQVYLDGFLTVGAGRNNLEMANDVLALESDYTTRTATIGAALSGVYDYSSYEFRPELAFTYGRTWIGNVAFTGRAYGLVDDTLSLDAGDVSIGTLILRPEVVWGLDADTLAESHTRFSFAPRLICESVDAGAVREDCGGGVELGLSSVSEDGLSEFTARVLADRIGNSNRSSFAINLEHRF